VIETDHSRKKIARGNLSEMRRPGIEIHCRWSGFQTANMARRSGRWRILETVRRVDPSKARHGKPSARNGDTTVRFETHFYTTIHPPSVRRSERIATESPSQYTSVLVAALLNENVALRAACSPVTLFRLQWP
jgi:hypothetical protein